jgi:hypothetical protein
MLINHATTTLAAALLLAGGASAQLNKLAKAAGKLYFGSATDNGELSDSSYMSILKNTNEIGQLVSLPVLFSAMGALWDSLLGRGR